MDFENLDHETLLRRLAEEKRKREAAEERAEREKERADRFEAERAPTSLERYLQLVQDFLVSTLSVENDSAKVTSGGMTNVDGKWYPRELHRWDDFENEHSRVYNMFLEELSNKQLFPSYIHVNAIRSNLLESRQQNELDVRPYVHGAIESPVRQVVLAYLRHVGNMDELSFRNTGQSLDQKDNASAEG
ncbi:hypothetical protein VTN31DRAFT_2386 [Thermomyces dupontii]|uniref:uncharacterized protein n=1 Tax=Talaromyces thermophilus TaxID=28565 RepID=UPI0037423217